MKVPKSIKNSIIKSADYYSKANSHNKKIRDWIIKNNFNNDSVLDMLIDSTQLGYAPIEFIKNLENILEENKGNNKFYE